MRCWCTHMHRHWDTSACCYTHRDVHMHTHITQKALQLARSISWAPDVRSSSVARCYCSFNLSIVQICHESHWWKLAKGHDGPVTKKDQMKLIHTPRSTSAGWTTQMISRRIEPDSINLYRLICALTSSPVVATADLQKPSYDSARGISSFLSQCDSIFLQNESHNGLWMSAVHLIFCLLNIVSFIKEHRGLCMRHSASVFVWSEGRNKWKGAI